MISHQEVKGESTVVVINKITLYAVTLECLGLGSLESIDIDSSDIDDHSPCLGKWSYTPKDYSSLGHREKLKNCLGHLVAHYMTSFSMSLNSKWSVEDCVTEHDNFLKNPAVIALIKELTELCGLIEGDALVRAVENDCLLIAISLSKWGGFSNAVIALFRALWQTGYTADIDELSEFWHPPITRMDLIEELTCKWESDPLGNLTITDPNGEWACESNSHGTCKVEYTSNVIVKSSDVVELRPIDWDRPALIQKGETVEWNASKTAKTDGLMMKVSIALTEGDVGRAMDHMFPDGLLTFIENNTSNLAKTGHLEGAIAKMMCNDHIKHEIAWSSSSDMIRWLDKVRLDKMCNVRARYPLVLYAIHHDPVGFSKDPTRVPAFWTRSYDVAKRWLKECQEEHPYLRTPPAMYSCQITSSEGIVAMGRGKEQLVFAACEAFIGREFKVIFPECEPTDRLEEVS